MTMRIQLLGGPHDGQEMSVPLHLMHVTIPVPGSTSYTMPTFENPNVPLKTKLWVATYQRVGSRGDLAIYRYSGQEEIGG